MKKKMFILSSGGESTRMIEEEAQSRGHEVTVIDPMECDLVVNSSPSGYDSILHQGQRLYSSQIDVLITRSGSGAKYGLSVIRQFEKMGIPVTNTAVATENAANKFRCGQVLSRGQLRQPKTVYSRRPANIQKLIAQVGGLPVVVKEVSGSQGNGVFILETKLSANTTLESIYKKESDIVLQEYMPNARDLRLWVIDGEYKCAMERMRLKNDFRANASKGAEVKKIEPTKEEKELAIKAADACGLGIAGVDILRDKLPYVLEVNSSPGLIGITSVNPDANLPGAIVDYAEKIAKGSSKKEDKTGANIETRMPHEIEADKALWWLK